MKDVTEQLDEGWFDKVQKNVTEEGKCTSRVWKKVYAHTEDRVWTLVMRQIRSINRSWDKH